jgi:electron transport complex protein RnfG
MKEIIRLSAILLSICLVAALALAVTNDMTIDKILEQRELVNQQARQAVLAEATSFEAIPEADLGEIVKQESTVREVYAGLNDGTIIGYVVKSGPNGFGGAVEVTTGIGVDNMVKGVRIGSHQETPGLGANATLPAFYDQFTGMSAASEIGVSKTTKSDTEILAITGATITSRAVTDGVNASIRVVETLNR